MIGRWLKTVYCILVIDNDYTPKGKTSEVKVVHTELLT